MTRKLPEELAPVMAKLGQKWPEADEDGLRQAAGVWREFGTEAERLTRRGGDSVQRVTSENSGPSIDAFAEHWRAFAGGGRGHLDDAGSAAEHLGTAFDKAAGAVDHCKAELVTVLTELAAALKKADDARAQAEQAKTAAAAAPAAGVAGVVGAVVGAVGQAVKDVDAAAEEAAAAVALDAAKIKVAHLLEELGREMKDGLQAALGEPALTTLDRIARGRGPLAGAGVLAGAGGVVGGVRTVSAVVGPNGKLMVIGPDGRKVPASEGLHATIVGGKAVVVGPDGNAVTGLATGLDGKLLTGTDGKPLLVGVDGALGASGLSVAVGADGKPALGRDGHPMLLDASGNLLSPLTADGQGSTPGGPDGMQKDSHGHHRGADGGLGLGLTTPDGSSVSMHAGLGNVGVQVSNDTSQSQGDGGDGGYAQHVRRGHRGWVDNSGYQPAAAAETDYRQSYDAYEPPPEVHHGSTWVRTDSVLVAPPDTSAVFDHAPGVMESGVGGGWRSGESEFSGGAAPGGGFQLGPVGGAAEVAPAMGAPMGGAPIAPGPIGTGPIGTAPIGATPGAGPLGPGVSAPGAAPMSGAPTAGSPGAAGQPGSMMVGAGPGVPAGGGVGSRTPAAPGGVGVPGGGAAAAQPTPVPVRAPEPYVGFRPREDTVQGTGQPPQSGTPMIGLIPGGLAAAYLINRALGTQNLAPGVELPHIRTSADGRPYGLPGGLGPVDPAHQAELERRVPVNEDGYALPFPDPRAGDWAEALNGGGARETGRHNNCVDIALSAADTFAGRPTCSAPRLPDGPAGERGGRDRAERELGTRFLDLGDGPAAHDKLSRALLAAGPGSQAVLCTLDQFGRSHSWNAVNHEGVLTYLDHQTARQSAEPLYPADHGLWAIALDAVCRPMDLTNIQVPVSVPESAPEPEDESAAAVAPRSRLTAHRTSGSKESAPR